MIQFISKLSNCKLLTEQEATYCIFIKSFNVRSGFETIILPYFFSFFLFSALCLVFFIHFSVVFCCLFLVFVLNVIFDTQRGTEIPPVPLVHSSPLSTLSKPFVSNVLFNCVP